MNTASEHFEQEATEADERDYLPENLMPVEVQVVSVPKAALAVRFEQVDLDRLRERAIAEGVGVTQLVRAWVLERLYQDDDELSVPAAELLAQLRRLLAAKARGDG